MTAMWVHDPDAVEDTAAAFDLRRPNEMALDGLALAVATMAQRGLLPFEGVAAVATGVGKTYLMAGAIDYFATACNVRNFMIVVPGKAILDKTVNQFTAGTRKSLLVGMNVIPEVITAENFQSASKRAAIEDSSKVKVFVFTVQSLLKPGSKQGRKTHSFTEELGYDLYSRLRNMDDLVVFADEHHTYFGPAFSKAIKDLGAPVTVGLTATPHPSMPSSQVFFKYGLGQALADKLVKAPVLVGRTDDLNDSETKLLDGLTLLARKQELLDAYCATQQRERVNATMLVVAPSIKEANYIKEQLSDKEFFDGKYGGDACLVVTSESPDDDLAALGDVENPDSPVRVIISVGMLKEGWDVKTVYVIVSLRASVSDILTEQTLGRGLRLPFGAYTGIEMLDTLEVIVHERYEQLLKRAGALSTDLMDTRRWVEKVIGDDGQTSIEVVEAPAASVAQAVIAGIAEAGDNETFLQETAVLTQDSGGVADSTTEPIRTDASHEANDAGLPSDVTDCFSAPPRIATPVESQPEADANRRAVPNAREVLPIATPQERGQALARATEVMLHELTPQQRVDGLSLRLPVVTPESAAPKTSLVHITDYTEIRKLGRMLSDEPEDLFRRTVIRAQTVTDSRGEHAKILATEAQDAGVRVQKSLLPIDMAELELKARLLNSGIVPKRENEAKHAERIVEEFVNGLDATGKEVLGRLMERVAARLIQTVREQIEAQQSTAVTWSHNVTWASLPVRPSRDETSDDRYGTFRLGCGYHGWKKSLYTQAWFDSEPERHLANIADNAGSVLAWMRLNRGDIQIRWKSHRNYNPDFLVIEDTSYGRVIWVVEVKADDHATNDDVLRKKEAAKTWVNHVTVNREADSPQWRYLFVTETDLEHAHDNWVALVGLARGWE